MDTFSTIGRRRKKRKNWVFIRSDSTWFPEINAVCELSPFYEPFMESLLVIITKCGSKGYENKKRISFKFSAANLNALTSEI